MNRRAFLKLFVGTVAVATLPIPKFLIPKQEELIFGNLQGTSYSSGAGILTQEMVENAAIIAASNHGKPEYIITDEETANKIFGVFGYRIVYEN